MEELDEISGKRILFAVCFSTEALVSWYHGIHSDEDRDCAHPALGKKDSTADRKMGLNLIIADLQAW